jgi:squamous cell carcinoma antigen recognized by T-cells 3
MATDANGGCKGFAFVEYEEEVCYSLGDYQVKLKKLKSGQKDAHAALAANNHELKKRRLAVTLSNPSIRARNRWAYLTPAYL